MTRPFICRCGHTRPNHQPADRWSPETCTMCSVCSRTKWEHYNGPGHSFAACQCWRDEPAGDDAETTVVAPGATETAEHGSGDHRTAEGGTA